jgi:lantibiotic biosynthesis protein
LKENSVSVSNQTQIVETLHVINRLNKPQENINLQTFIKRFTERYENTEMPLLEVLDVETGIGYIESYKGDILPMVDDIAVPPKPSTDTEITFTKKDTYLLKKLTAALVANKYELQINETELTDFENSWDALPPSMAVMFRLLDDEKIFIESVGGSSAVNLLGRFAHGNGDIHDIVKDIVSVEEAQNPDVIFAEIVHLPESRLGNILQHPAFRKYEIPFLAKSSVNSNYQITLQDLYVSVNNNKIILRSKKLNKQIIPRLSTAHNYSYRALPVYQFLCDLQLQDNQTGIYFNWGVLENLYQFLPRVSYKNCIVYAATWHFEKKDIESFLLKTDAALLEAIAEFRIKWKLPLLIVLADNDNELLINIEDVLMIQIWLDTVKNRKSFIIKEYLDHTKNAVVKGIDGKYFTNQFIATLVKSKVTYQTQILTVENNITPVEQTFAIGSQWLYYKIYCGTKLADSILTKAILPLVQILLQQKNITSFFFIRYNDPHFHLRIRFKLTDVIDVAEVIQLFTQQIAPYLNNNTVWKIQTDTYKRELNRYGKQAITIAEDLFYYDSIAVIKLLQLYEDDAREQVRWQWAIKSIDDLLNDFELTLPEKCNLFEQIKNAFHTEYNANKFLKNQLATKYRTHKNTVEKILSKPFEHTNQEDIIFAEKSNQTKLMAQALSKMESEKQLEVNINSLLTSYIHMLINRIVPANPRLHELVIYDMLFQYYKSMIEKLKKNF